MSRHSMIFILLALLFLAPGLSALFFFQHPHLLKGRPTNKGDFIKPPVLLHELASLPMGPTNQPQWHLLLWISGDCDAHCETALDQLVRIRLALGRRYYEVSQSLLIKPASHSQTVPLKHRLHHSGIGLIHLSSEESDTLSKEVQGQSILIANPQGFVVLSYPITVHSDDVYHDLKQLLGSRSEL